MKYPDPFNQEITNNKAVLVYFAQAVPLVTYIDESCIYLKEKKCRICETVCKNKAIDFSKEPEQVKVNVGAIILASGIEPFDPKALAEYRYGQFANVVTSMDYERLLSSIHNENTLDQYFGLGRRLGRLLYEGRWYDPESLLLKDALTRWIAPSVTGTVTLELRRGDDYSILRTEAEHMSYAPEKLSMERVEEAPFTPEDRIGALELQNLNVGDNRALLIHHLDSVRKLTSGPSLGGLLGFDSEG